LVRHLVLERRSVYHNREVKVQTKVLHCANNWNCVSRSYVRLNITL
jgi:hypothetical protein